MQRLAVLVCKTKSIRMKNFPSHVNFRTGALRSKEIGYILAEDENLVEQDASHTVVLTWHKGTYYKHPLQWVAKSCCVVQKPKEQLLAISGDGDFLVFGQGDTLEGRVRKDPGPKDKTGPFRNVCVIDGTAYAVGMDRILYTRVSSEEWLPFDTGLPAGGDLEFLDGFSKKDMYAVGWKGEIWHYDGRKWKLVGNPTNMILTSVVCAGDGNVYCVGQKGIVIRGRDTKWEVLEHQTTEGDLWDVEWFNDTVWVSSMQLVYTLKGDELAPVDFGKDEPDTTYHLSTAGGVLWSIGQKDIMAFDGKKWTRVE
jgi:hypothetical protein